MDKICLGRTGLMVSRSAALILVAVILISLFYMVYQNQYVSLFEYLSQEEARLIYNYIADDSYKPRLVINLDTGMCSIHVPRKWHHYLVMHFNFLNSSQDVNDQGNRYFEPR